MNGAIPPLPQYAFMAWCSVKKIAGTTLFYFTIVVCASPILQAGRPPLVYVPGLLPSYTYINVKVSLFINQALRHEDVRRSGSIARLILNRCTRWIFVVTFTPRSLYLQSKRPRNSMRRRLGAPQSRSGQWHREEIPPLVGNRVYVVQPVVRYFDKLIY